MTETKFDASDYWKTRLEKNFDLTGVGFLRRSETYNRWVYRLRTESLDKLFERNGWQVKDKAVLDIGCGTGYFIDHWSKRNAGSITGLDLAEVSVRNLREKFPNARFECADIAENGLELERTFDFISVFDVLYHIVDDRRFEQAAGNLARLCRPGGKVIISDIFGGSTNQLRRHVRHRSLEEYLKNFARVGFSFVEKKPLFFTLMPPGAGASRMAYFVGTLLWGGFTWPARWRWFGEKMGRWLYEVDRKMQGQYEEGPSYHLAVFELKGTPTV